MPFGGGRKVTVEPSFDRETYAPGQAVQIVAPVQGETPDRVRGGKATLWMRFEMRNARGRAPGKTNAAGTYGQRDQMAKTDLGQVEPAADGTPRVAGALVLPADATPSEESQNLTVEWLVRVDVSRKGIDRGCLVPITVAAPG